MGTQYDTPKNQGDAKKPINEQDTLQTGQIPPMQPFLPSPQRPARQKSARWVLVSAIAIVLVLVLTLGTVLFVQQRQQPPVTQVTPTPTSSAATAMPGLDITATPAPGVTPGPQPGPPNSNTPAYWDAILGTQSGIKQVESVSFAHMMDTPALQALVTVRYVGSDAKLDVYVFTNITNAKPTQIFKLVGLTKGDAKISGYDTVMTAEVDKNSALNSGKAISGMTPDLFREFAWSSEENTLTQAAFPGIFPDLTRYQAEADQARVNRGQDAWKNDPGKVAKALVGQFFDWRRDSMTKLLSGGGPKDISATVQVQEVPMSGGQTQGPNVLVTLSRLEGNTHNIWVAISVADGSMLQLNNIDERQLIASPVTLQGSGSAFEAVIGQAVVYDHLYTDIGHAQILGDKGMAQTTYSTKVIYTSSFRAGVQEGVVAVYEANGGISDEIYTAVMVKVLLNPQQRVVQGPVSCPVALQEPTSWEKLLGLDSTDGGVGTVSCANLKGNASLQALVPVYYANSQPGASYVYDQLTSAQPAQIFKLQTHSALISGSSTIMT